MLTFPVATRLQTATHVMVRQIAEGTAPVTSQDARSRQAMCPGIVPAVPAASRGFGQAGQQSKGTRGNTFSGFGQGGSALRNSSRGSSSFGGGGGFRGGGGGFRGGGRRR